MESLLASLTAKASATDSPTTPPASSTSHSPTTSRTKSTPLNSCADYTPDHDSHQCPSLLAQAHPSAPLDSGSEETSRLLNDIDRLADAMGDLSVGRERYVGRGSGIHIAQSLHEASVAGAGEGVGPGCGPEDVGLVELLLTARFRKAQEGHALPEAGLAGRLVEAYFENVNEYAPLLHRPYFERCVRDGLLETDLSFRSLYFMCCALGSRYVDDDSVFPTDPTGLHFEGPQQSRGYDFFISASVTCSPKLSPATLFDLQSQCLTVLWLAASASPTTAWSATGHAFRRLVDVGAHREKATRWNRSPLHDQLRRRCFAVMYDADRHLSATLGRPVALHEGEFDVLDPLDLTDDELDEWERRGGQAPGPTGRTTPVTGLLALHRLRKITEKILVALYSTGGPGSVEQINERVTELDSVLNEWLAELPAELQWNPARMDKLWLVQSGVLMSSWYATQILLHRDFLSPAKGNLHPFPSRAICSNASRSIAQVLNVLREEGVLELGAQSHAMSAITASLCLLINVFAQAPTGAALTSSAMEDVAKCERVLDVLGARCFMARRCHVALGEMVAKIRQGQRFAAQGGGEGLGGLGGLKRAAGAEDGSGVSSSSSAHSPAAASASEGSPRQAGAAKKSKSVGAGAGAGTGMGSVTELPMTTHELGRSTFAGRATFDVSKAAAVGGVAGGAGEAGLGAGAGAAWIDSFLGASNVGLPVPLTSDPAPYQAWTVPASVGGLPAAFPPAATGVGLPVYGGAPGLGVAYAAGGGEAAVAEAGWGGAWGGGFEAVGDGYGLPAGEAGVAGFPDLSFSKQMGFDAAAAGGGAAGYGGIDWDALLGGSPSAAVGAGEAHGVPAAQSGYYGF